MMILWAGGPFPFYKWKTKAPRDWVTCPRSLSLSVSALWPDWAQSQALSFNPNVSQALEKLSTEGIYTDREADKSPPKTDLLIKSDIL